MARKIEGIILHTTATPKDWMSSRSIEAKVAEIRRWHTDPKPKGRGWSDIGYHYLIDRDGEYGLGRNIQRIGAHTRGKNRGTIGIALIGGKGAKSTDHFDDHFTAEQRYSAHMMIIMLRAAFGPLWLAGHNEFSTKGCPGFKVAEEFHDLAAQPSRIGLPARNPRHSAVWGPL